MLRISFHGSDDGFTFLGVILLLFVILILMPSVTAYVASWFERNERILNERHELYMERQSEIMKNEEKEL